MIKQPTRPLAIRRSDIVGIAARSGSTEEQLGTRPPAFEKIVVAASEHVGDDGLHQVVWKGCSGLAHGRQWATVALMQGAEHSRDENEVVLRQLTAGLPFVINAASAAAVMTKRAWELLDHRRRRWYGTRRRPPGWRSDGAVSQRGRRKVRTPTVPVPHFLSPQIVRRTLEATVKWWKTSTGETAGQTLLGVARRLMGLPHDEFELYYDI